MSYNVRYYRQGRDVEDESGSIGNFDTQFECVKWAREYREFYPLAIFDVIDVDSERVVMSLSPKEESKDGA